ncbi:MAG: hypothetical protein M1831_004841 [Alyxoria varia]|nr:MAG: hypothetical protein M1831_004841 [Alyxoria varia]
MKRKRKSRREIHDQPSKRQTKEDEAESRVVREHPVLKKLYGKVVPLREYILSQLPEGSKRKRKLKANVRQIKHERSEPQVTTGHDRLCDILDGCVVGVRDVAVLDSEIFKESFSQFSQQLSELTGTPRLSFQLSSQAELVDFVTWILFHKTYPHVNRPPHMLCHGTQRAAVNWRNQAKIRARSTIPGLACMFPNEYVEMLKSPPWTEMTNLLGSYGERIAVTLFVNHAIFAPVKGSPKSYYQICGMPVSDLTPLVNEPSVGDNVKGVAGPNHTSFGRKSSSITFVRHRMLYARAGMNAKREASLGLRHIHVFNRYPDPERPVHTVHIMKYLFPRQFGLHNVFTSKVDPKETTHPFKDYTLRESEIAGVNLMKSIGKSGKQNTPNKNSSLPKRLRGAACEIVNRLQKSHGHCAYVELLNHYCPRQDLDEPKTALLDSKDDNQSMPHFTQLATPVAHVSVFCQAVFRNVFPYRLFGETEGKGHNIRILGKHIDRFLRARRFESFTLESVMNGIKTSQPLKAGSSLFSVDEMYGKVRSYKQSLRQSGQAGKRLYFAKVDVTSCFDNLPQSRLLEIVQDLLSSDEYDIARYAELRSLFHASPTHDTSRPIKKFHAEAEAAGNFERFERRLRAGKNARKNHVFADNVVHQRVKTEQALGLLNEHILRNIVKIGKKYYRQKRGVPQGSILSTILCNFCYAAFEEEKLGFLSVGDSLLLRLIDDFLLITPDRQVAKRFIEVMHTGDESYGVSVKQEKSLVNFDMKVNSHGVAMSQKSSAFPFCGMSLDQQSLEITKDAGVIQRGRAQDALTAEYSKMPGNTFRRKMTSAAKIHMHTMLFDMSHNTPTTVLRTLHKLLLESASRCFHYLKCVPALKRTSTLLIDIVKDLAALTIAKLRSRRNRARCPQYKCSIRQETVRWLTSTAFKSFFERKQAGHADFVKWLACDQDRFKAKLRRDWIVLQRIVGDCD